ncbi:MAG: SMC-Scp complex subunit ScpB [Candidatus Moraniibacteriota bacterium]
MNKEEKKELRRKIEAIIFAGGEEVMISKIADFLGIKKDDVLKEIKELHKYYQENMSGLSLIWDEEKAQMTTCLEVAETVVDFHQKNKESPHLSRPLLEVLSIVAYRGPISRPGIDYIRGVNSHLAIRKLTALGLLEKKENPDDSRSYLYKTSLDFLKTVGVNKLENLPYYDKLSREEIFIKENE